MIFSSSTFIFYFLPLTWIIFTICKNFNNRQISLLILIVSSLIFYAYYDFKLLSILLISIAINYLIGKSLINSKKNSKYILTLGVVFNLSLLIYFKYKFFIFENFSLLLSHEFSLTKLVIPLGISFFTFQQIAWLSDIHRKKVEKINIIEYFAFVSFFPQLIAGPIVHHSEIIPQLRSSIFPDAYKIAFTTPTIDSNIYFQIRDGHIEDILNINWSIMKYFNEFYDLNIPSNFTSNNENFYHPTHPFPSKVSDLLDKILNTKKNTQTYNSLEKNFIDLKHIKEYNKYRDHVFKLFVQNSYSSTSWSCDTDLYKDRISKMKNYILN